MSNVLTREIFLKLEAMNEKKSAGRESIDLMTSKLTRNNVKNICNK